jgi:hypothetical protein
MHTSGLLVILRPRLDEDPDGSYFFFFFIQGFVFQSCSCAM